VNATIPTPIVSAPSSLGQDGNPWGTADTPSTNTFSSIQEEQAKTIRELQKKNKRN